MNWVEILKENLQLFIWVQLGFEDFDGEISGDEAVEESKSEEELKDQEERQVELIK